MAIGVFNREQNRPNLPSILPFGSFRPTEIQRPWYYFRLDACVM